MDENTACQIAKNYLNNALWITGIKVHVKSKEPDNSRIVVEATDAEKPYNEEAKVYEVTLYPLSNEISARRVLHDGALSDYLREETRLSLLNPGQYFTLAGDCVIYEYYGPAQSHGTTRYMASRKGQSSYFYMGDEMVYPMS